MKLTCENTNYCATVIRIHNLVECPGLDKLVAIPAFGYSALVSKDHHIGELGVFFVAETQLSEDFCRENSLFRDKELNKDKEKSSYMENSRRIKPLKLRGNTSTALFMPLSCFTYLGVNIEDFKEGDVFTHINGNEVCRKYIIKVTQSRTNKVKGQTLKRKLVDENIFKQHIETEHFLRNLKNFKDDDTIIVTEKIHSTSGRFGYILVERKLSRFERFLKWCGVKINYHEYKYVSGSRRVVKEDGSEQSFYNENIWHNELEKIKLSIPKDTVIYGEIVGWDNDKALQKNYTYRTPQGTTELYVYRIATVNPDGFMIDWSWSQIKTFCKNNGIKYCPEIFVGKFKDFNYTIYENKKFREELGLTQCLPLDNDAPCSEGLVIRLEGTNIPYLTKYKSPDFYLHEGVVISSGIVDTESQESCVFEDCQND